MKKPVTVSFYRIRPMIRVVAALAVLAAALFFISGASAKCPQVPGEMVCPNLSYTFLPVDPIPGDEVSVTAVWIDQLSGEPVTNSEWLATRGKPAYIWLWDHRPSEPESVAYVDTSGSNVPLPQIVAPLTWDAETLEYRGNFVLPAGGRWYFRFGTVVPNLLTATLEADFDYVGTIEHMDISSEDRLIDNILARLNQLIAKAASWISGQLSR